MSRGKHALKSALSTSRAYCDRRRPREKRHNAALIYLARRRTDVIEAMHRDQRPYTAPTVKNPDPGS